MKEKIKKFFRENGYAAAIYCCVALVVVLAAGVAVFDSAVGRYEEEGLTGYDEAVNNSRDKSYKEESSEKTTPDSSSKTSDASSKPADKASGEPADKSADNAKSAANNEANSAEKPRDGAEDNKTGDKSENKSESDTKTASAHELFAFDENSQEMLMPVEGRIVMDYSPEVAVFDPTLEQYRTNDTICIAGEIGTPVAASADGVVYDAGYDEINGNFVVIDHGNGWMSTYSQLEENVPVAVGDIVNAGDIIAGIGEPTDFQSAMGPHLEFYLTHNDESYDPNLIFGTLD